MKHPGDGFKRKPKQAAAYPVGAQCWLDDTPPKVLPHTEATTALLCSQTKLTEYAPYLRYFEPPITFEDVKKSFPDASP